MEIIVQDTSECIEVKFTEVFIVGAVAEAGADAVGGAIKNSVDTGEILTINAGEQYIVYRDFTANGLVIGDGELVIL